MVRNGPTSYRGDTDIDFILLLRESPPSKARRLLKALNPVHREDYRHLVEQ